MWGSLFDQKNEDQKVVNCFAIKILKCIEKRKVSEHSLKSLRRRKKTVGSMNNMDEEDVSTFDLGQATYHMAVIFK